MSQLDNQIILRSVALNFLDSNTTLINLNFKMTTGEEYIILWNLVSIHCVNKNGYEASKLGIYCLGLQTFELTAQEEWFLCHNQTTITVIKITNCTIVKH